MSFAHTLSVVLSDVEKLELELPCGEELSAVELFLLEVIDPELLTVDTLGSYFSKGRPGDMADVLSCYRGVNDEGNARCHEGADSPFLKNFTK